jgi:type III secretion system SsaH family protein
MSHLDRESRRLLVQLALAAAGQRFHEEARALAGVLDLLISDPRDRAVCAACIHMQTGDAGMARAALAGRDDEAARLVLELASVMPAAPAARIVR